MLKKNWDFQGGPGRLALFFLLLGLLVTGPAGVLKAQDSMRAAAVVNDEIISVLDLAMRIRLAILGAGVQDTQESRNRIAGQVLRRLIDERLQLQEAKRLDITVSEEEVVEALNSLAEQNKLTQDQFLDLLRQRSILPQTLTDQIRAQLAWQGVMQRSLSPSVSVSPEEIDEIVARLTAQSSGLVRRVSEISLAVPTALQENEVRLNAQRIVEQIRGGANFSGLARQFSQSATANLGGDLGWIRAGQLPEDMGKVLNAMTVGQVSDPIRTPSGFTILQLKDTKEAEESDIDRGLIEQNLRTRRVERLAQRSLQELRRTANIDIRI